MSPSIHTKHLDRGKVIRNLNQEESREQDSATDGDSLLVFFGDEEWGVKVTGLRVSDLKAELI